MSDNPHTFPRHPWLAVWKPSLGRTMTVAFTLFGLIIGYIAIAFSVMIVTAGSVFDIRNMVLRDLAGGDSAGGGDALLTFVGSRRDDIARLFRINEHLSVRYHTFRPPRLLYRSHLDASWKEIYIDAESHVREKALPDAESSLVEESIGRGRNWSALFGRRGQSPCFFHGSRPRRLVQSVFYGRGDRHVFIADITRPADRNQYYVYLDMTRAGIVTIFRGNLPYFLIIAAFLVIVSHLLGHLFAWHLARPVRALAESAAQIASGDFRKRFQDKRRDEIGTLARSLNSMAERTESHISQIEQRMKTIETMNRIDKAVLSSISRRDLLDRVIGIVSLMMDCRSVGLGLRNDARGGYEVLSYYDRDGRQIKSGGAFLADDELGPIIRDRQVELFQLCGEGVIEAEFPQALSFMGREVGTLMNVPLFITERYLGSMVLTRSGTGGFTEEEESTAKMLADQVAVALQSVRAFEERENLLVGILIALTRSIDAKSRWTAGHSERVAVYAEAMSVRMGMGEEELRTVTISAILHDIGKFAVSESILDKPGPLTEEEMAVVRTHPDVGAKILSGIPFYETIMPGVLHHHERWNGSGYPDGLAGADISLNGRILAIADVYDAITDDRPYRRGWGGEEAIRFMKEQKEAMFDPGLVDLFLKVLADRDFLNEIRERRKILG